MRSGERTYLHIERSQHPGATSLFHGKNTVTDTGIVVSGAFSQKEQRQIRDGPPLGQSFERCQYEAV
jgi:hypothetical protein